MEEERNVPPQMPCCIAEAPCSQRACLGLPLPAPYLVTTASATKKVPTFMSELERVPLYFLQSGDTIISRLLLEAILRGTTHYPGFLSATLSSPNPSTSFNLSTYSLLVATTYGRTFASSALITLLLPSLLSLHCFGDLDLDIVLKQPLKYLNGSSPLLGTPNTC